MTTVPHSNNCSGLNKNTSFIMLHFRCLNYPLLYRVRVWRSDSMQPPTARLKEAHYNENVGSGGGERKGSD